MKDKYGCLLSYRDNEGNVQRIEGKGTYTEVLGRLAEYRDENVISAEIWHIISEVVK